MTDDTQAHANKMVMCEYSCDKEKMKHTHTHTHLCDVLCWHDSIADVPASWSLCQDSARGEVAEVGLDLG